MSPAPASASGKYVNLLLLLALGTLWGASYLFIKVIVAEAPALTLVAGRLGVAALTMWVVVCTLRLRMPRHPRMWGVFALLGLVGLAMPYSLITWGEQYIASGLAALLQATTPLFTVLLAQLLTGDERITVVVTYIIPINGVILGALVLHETLSLTVVASLALILVAILLVRGRKP